MPVNSDKPQLWKKDVARSIDLYVARSIDLYNDCFIKFAPLPEEEIALVEGD